MTSLISKISSGDTSRETADDVLLTMGWSRLWDEEIIIKDGERGMMTETEGGEPYFWPYLDAMNSNLWYPPNPESPLPLTGKYIEGFYRPNPLTRLTDALNLKPHWAYDITTYSTEEIVGWVCEFKFINDNTVYCGMADHEDRDIAAACAATIAALKAQEARDG